MQLLSEDAILHISAGFEGPFILQAFSIKHDLYKRGIFNFCVTDGTVYIGARYEFQEDLGLDNYNLIQITAKFVDRSHPIIIRTLDIISTSLKKLVGNPPYTLQDYFNREAKNTEGEEPLKKRIKANIEEASPVPVRKDMGFKKAANTPKREPSNSQRQQNKNESEKKSEVINLEGSDKRLLKLDSSSQEQVHNSRIDAIFNLDESDENQKDTPIAVDSQLKNEREIQKTGYIKDLYERSTGWVIFCRVNYISIVECQNGLFAANFILSDEEGGEIRCVYFACSMEQARETLKVGQCYMLSSGEVKYSHKQKELHITFDRNSEIVPQKNERFRATSRKFIRIDKVLEKQHSSIVSVVGVIRKINSRQHLRAKRKYTATLCDPLRLIQTDFMLFLNNQEKEIRVGMVIVLHNFQVYSQNNICRLNSTYKSYYYQQNGREGGNEAITQIYQLVSESDSWKILKYKNISLFTFNHRTIHDFRELYRGTTDDSKLYTQLDVWVFDVTLKTSYYACKNCKRSTEVKEMNLYQCSTCKRMVDTIMTHTLCGTFADFTGSCNIDVIGEHAQNLLEMKSSEFHALTPDEQNNHLESLKYKNMVIRLKSQKRGEKRESHSVWGIEKACPDMTLRQIKKKMHFYRLKKEEQQW